MNTITNIQLKRNGTIYPSHTEMLKAIKDKATFIDNNKLSDGEVVLLRYYNTDKIEVRTVLGYCVVTKDIKDIILDIPAETIDEINKTLNSLKPKSIIQVEKYVKAFNPLTNRHYEFTSSDIRNYFVEGYMVMVNEKTQLTGVPIKVNLSKKNEAFSVYYNVSGLTAHKGNKVLRFIPWYCTTNDVIQVDDIKENFPIAEDTYVYEGKTFSKLKQSDITRVYIVPQFSNKQIDGKYLSRSKGYEFEIPSNLSGTAYDIYFEFADGDFKRNKVLGYDASLILSNFTMFNAYSGDYIDNYSYDITHEPTLAYQRFYSYTHVFSDGSTEELTIPYDTSKIEK